MFPFFQKRTSVHSSQISDLGKSREGGGGVKYGALPRACMITGGRHVSATAVDEHERISSLKADSAVARAQESKLLPEKFGLIEGTWSPKKTKCTSTVLFQVPQSSYQRPLQAFCWTL